MGLIADLMVEGRALLARCATDGDARAHGRIFGQRAAAVVTSFEAETGQRHGTHRWDVDADLLKAVEAAEAARADVPIRFYRTARATYKAELKAPG